MALPPAFHVLMYQINLYTLDRGLPRDHLYPSNFRIEPAGFFLFLFCFYKMILKCFLLAAMAIRILHGMGIVKQLCKGDRPMIIIVKFGEITHFLV